MNIKKSFQLFTASSLIALSLQTQAEIINHGRYLTDTDTGLDWLDVTESVGISFDDMQYLLETGEKFEGWRYAKKEEVRQLVENYTGIVVHLPDSGSNYFEDGVIDGLVDMLGSTLDTFAMEQYGTSWNEWAGYPEGGFQYVHGITSDVRADESWEDGQMLLYALYDDDVDYTGPDVPNDFYTRASVDSDFARSNNGSFLVRESQYNSLPFSDEEEACIITGYTDEDLSSSYHTGFEEGYNEAFELGKQVCIDSPESCGINIIEIGKEEPNDKNKIEICHKSKRTKYVPKKALQDHLNHGDTFGACMD